MPGIHRKLASPTHEWRGEVPRLGQQEPVFGSQGKIWRNLGYKTHRDFASPFARLIPTLEAQTMLFAHHVGAFNNVPVGYVCVDTGFQFH